MRHEIQQRVEEWRISLPDGSWRAITMANVDDSVPGWISTFRDAARKLGISYEPKVQRRLTLRTTVTIKTVTDQPGEWRQA